ncbi:MAG: ferrous iron transport protein A [Thermoguttaceae bacterium]|nr:ferrous iron transport protein A [Thermoguttaceae bacterium]MDW8038018.1 ferrous iron transport protein A [Thermoguttaceae bacterium]
MNGWIPLERCPEGYPVRIVSMSGPQAEVHRLRELGLRPGCRLRVFRRGNPCILCLNGHSLCFRPSPHLQVLVEPEKPLPVPKTTSGWMPSSLLGRFWWRCRRR